MGSGRWGVCACLMSGLVVSAAGCVPGGITGTLAVEAPADAAVAPLPPDGGEWVEPPAPDAAEVPPAVDAGAMLDAADAPDVDPTDAVPIADASPLDSGPVYDPNLDPDVFALAGLPRGATQLAALCARGHGDSVTAAFCGATPPRITSLTDLQALLGLAFRPGVTTNAANGNPGFALTSHSSSLVMRFTSPINPRAIIFTAPLPNARVRPTNPLPNPRFVAMGFVRGEQFVELVSKDPSAGGRLRFFLFRFEQACNAAPGGCSAGELLSPAIERGFTAWTLYEDEDIKNTVFDCAQCHQPQGPTTPKILRMQELQFPWVHWLFNEPQGNVLLKADFLAAHPDEDYAGIPAAAVPQAAPPKLELFVEHNGFMNQPNEFLTRLISQEVAASNPAQPAMNVPPGVSSTWQGLYANYLAGTAIPPPYHDFKITDASKLSAMTSAYRSAMTGVTPMAQLPDIRDVFLDEALPDMTIRPRPNQSGRQILVQMCQQCHNSRLDQTLSRALFNVETLDQMSRGEKDLAIERIHLPKSAARHMPPDRFRELSAAEIDRVTQELLR